MPLESNRRLIRNAVLAALIGAAVGAGAGVYSLGRAIAPAAGERGSPAAKSTAEPPPPAPSEPSPAIESQRRADESTPIATNGVATRARHDSPSPKRDEPTRPSADHHADSPTAVLARARSLANRQDVVALMALRETVARAAEQRGDVDSPGVKSVLEQVDQRLNEARLLRLKLDAEQFRKASAAKDVR